MFVSYESALNIRAFFSKYRSRLFSHLQNFIKINLVFVPSFRIKRPVGWAMISMFGFSIALVILSVISSRGIFSCEWTPAIT